MDCIVSILGLHIKNRNHFGVGDIYTPQNYVTGTTFAIQYLAQYLGTILTAVSTAVNFALHRTAIYSLGGI